MNRLGWLACLVVALVACAPKTPASASVGNAQPLKLAIGQMPSSAVLWLTDEAGIFAKHGLRAELTPMNGAASIKSVVGGDMDSVVHAGAQLVLAAYAGGTALKVPAVLQFAYDLQLVVPSSVTSVQDMRGKTVGASSVSSAGASGARRYLKEHGLEVDRDYKFIETGSAGSDAGMTAQLITHQIDLAALTPTFAEQAVAQGGFRVLVDLASTDIRVASNVLVFRSAYVEQHPDIVQKTVDSLMEGVAYFKIHKSEAQKTLASRYEISDQAQLDALYERQAKLLERRPTPIKEDFVDTLSQLPKGSAPVSDDMLAALVEPRFVEDAVRRGVAS